MALGEPTGRPDLFPVASPCWVHHKAFRCGAGTSTVSKDERGDAGRFTESVTPRDVLGVFDRVEGPVVTSADVADALECSRETARRKLRSLEADDRVRSRTTAGRVVWWLADEAVVDASVDPADPFWELDPGSSGEHDVSTSVDEVLYGDS